MPPQSSAAWEKAICPVVFFQVIQQLLVRVEAVLSLVSVVFGTCGEKPFENNPCACSPRWPPACGILPGDEPYTLLMGMLAERDARVAKAASFEVGDYDIVRIMIVMMTILRNPFPQNF